MKKLGMMILIFGVTSCAPTFSSMERFTWEVRSSDSAIEKDGLKIEHVLSQNAYSKFFEGGKVNGLGDLEVTGNCSKDATSVNAKAFLISRTMVAIKLRITNNTDKVIRLNNSVIRLFDPADNQHEPAEKGDISAEVIREIGTDLPGWDCSSLISQVSKINTLKILNRNTELLPNLTWTGWIIFNTNSVDTMVLPGNWKLALYDVPTEIDESGKSTRVSRFEVVFVVKKWMDHYKTEFGGAPQKVKTEEVVQ